MIQTFQKTIFLPIEKQLEMTISFLKKFGNTIMTLFIQNILNKYLGVVRSIKIKFSKKLLGF